MKDMIGYSGLDCETCDAYIATVHDDLVLREKTAKLWAGLNNAPILPEHINCEGCRKHGAKTAFRSVFTTYAPRRIFSKVPEIFA